MCVAGFIPVADELMSSAHDEEVGGVRWLAVIGQQSAE